MRYPLFLCMLVSVLFLSSCGNDKPNPNEPENPDNPSGKKELWSRDKIVRLKSKSENLTISIIHTYDSQGREMSYKQYENNNLHAEQKNYIYNDLICTYDYYLKGVYGCKTTIEFYDESWNRGKIRSSQIKFNNSDIPTMRTEYQYDDQNREIGVKYYDDNILTQEHKNYRYEENRWSYDMYTSSSFVATSITEYTYNDTETIKRKYTAGAPSSYSEWHYDSEGREIGFQQYQDGKVTIEYKNYVYDGKVCTYDTYSNGTQTSAVLIEYY